jgi:hypothetical protein
MIAVSRADVDGDAGAPGDLQAGERWDGGRKEEGGRRKRSGRGAAESATRSAEGIRFHASLVIVHLCAGREPAMTS